MEWLYKRSSTGKIQQWGADWLDTHSMSKAFIITRFGQLNSKIQEVHNPPCIGKQKRSSFEQAEFELKALYKSKRDEGYKSLDDLGITNLISLHGDPQLCLEEKLNEKLPQYNTNKEGHLKVMLSQPISRVSKGATIESWHKIEYPVALEPKLDGVRCVMKSRPLSQTVGDLSSLFNNGPVMSLSRESMDYDFGTAKVRTKLEPLFDKYPNIVLDGELYKHDTPQNHISGAMRSKSGGEYKYVWDIMEYHVWDIIDTTLTYEERRTVLRELSQEFPDAFILNHAQIAHNRQEIDLFEEECVTKGYEGIMAKKLNALYQPDKRTFDSIKIKRFHDDEFEIIGLEQGKRGTQDLVVVCRTKEGITFKATAMGTLEEKVALSQAIDFSSENGVDIFGTVKYKFISENGKPSHAQFKGLK